ncbi:aminotransferase-like domain-containing protein [Sulfuracidifex tepidarius]|uniref:Aromatic-amino-acid aminotransferase 1 n=1 Tax=Sulfuracidifex tepidarius TaxID=1294262 RepID=A0A510E4U6_9CREN|nr:PLP-dependent aminotransferase family protein [Sulfuracidifex tepidarius]BBG24721.1 Aromatic-amino-acid aminotransferase 1 [Sulfuracidifex tepidarius]BBG27509.1 Aromatic-amino-acid aminotransferase 1 [Sulfuracidifex tepidarius]
MASRIGREIRLSPVELGSQIAKKVEINLASGNPDPAVMPVKEIEEAYNEVIENIGFKSLIYPGAGGQEELIESINKHFLPLLNVTTKDDMTVVTSGAQHAMELISKYFLENDVVGVENPTFVETFNTMKLRASVSLPFDVKGDGIDVDMVRSLTKVTKIKLLYVIPNCHNPAGVTMSVEKRKEIAELAHESDFFVIEDDPYRPIAGKVPPPIKNFDNWGKVIYVGSFSKILAPGLRVGFAVGDRKIMEKISLLEQLDFSTSTVNQYVVSLLLKKGLIKDLSSRMSEHYSNKMKVLTDSLTENGFDLFNKPSCGFFLLLDLKKDSWSVFREAVKGGLSFVPAKPFFLRGGNTMARLSITNAKEEEIRRGVEILRKSVNQL